MVLPSLTRSAAGRARTPEVSLLIEHRQRLLAPALVLLTALWVGVPVAAGPAARTGPVTSAGTNPSPPAAGDERDVILLNDGKEVRGRILQRYEEDKLIVLDGSRTVDIPRANLFQVVNDTRANLRTFLQERRPRLSLGEEWALVARADQLGLPRMGDLQAWHVLSLDPRHTGANERLGHRLRRGKWEWPVGRRWVEPASFEERITSWRERLTMESENYRVETNTSIEVAVNTLFDLERAYTYWLDHLGANLRAAEVPLEPQYRMKVWVFATREEPAYPRWTGGERVPFYGASQEYVTERGEPNIVYTDTGGSAYPRRLMELAAQQLLYTTMVHGRRTGNAPVTELGRPAYWAEVGVGYWFSQVFGGVPGYAAPGPFRPTSSVRRIAGQRAPRGSALFNRRKELPNLISLPFREYHTTDEEEVSYLGAKAKTFFTFLLVEDPPVVRNGQLVGTGREALLGYLRQVYGTPRGHSSSAFDDAVKPGKIEDLQPVWEEYLR